jgi:hypothetical protein
MTVRARWLAKYNTARLWAAIARRRYMWKPSEKNRAELERRRRQVEYALRVLKRHPKVGDDDFGCPLWIAAYQDHEPTLPKPWTRYAVWQYTSNGTVPGIHGNVDLNRTDDLRSLIA